VEPLIRALENGDWEVRRGAAQALGKVGDVRAVEPLSGALQDEHSRLRETAAQALGEIGDARAVKPLIGALRDEDVEMRWRAAQALGRLGDPRALPHLEQVEREDKGWTLLGTVADVAREAIEQIKAAQQTGNGQTQLPE
jgi:HEAT repeat protein